MEEHMRKEKGLRYRKKKDDLDSDSDEEESELLKKVL